MTVDLPHGPDPGLEYRGWVQLGEVAELTRLGATTVRRFGHDVAVWTDRGGRVHAAGTGSVTGGDPGLHRARGDASPRALPVAEVGGIAFMYRRPPGDDRDGPPPSPPAALAAALDAPSTRRSSFRLTIRTSWPSFAENSVDRAHFGPVHEPRVAGAGEYEIGVHPDGTLRGSVQVQVRLGRRRTAQTRTELLAADAFNGVTRSYYLGRPTDLLTLAAPLGDHRTDLLVVFLSPRGIPALGAIVHHVMRVEIRRTLVEDSTLLATRTFPARPILSDADGPILVLRHWLDRQRGPDDQAAEHRSADVTRVPVGAGAVPTTKGLGP